MGRADGLLQHGVKALRPQGCHPEPSKHPDTLNAAVAQESLEWEPRLLSQSLVISPDR